MVSFSIRLRPQMSFVPQKSIFVSNDLGDNELSLMLTSILVFGRCIHCIDKRVVCISNVCNLLKLYLFDSIPINNRNVGCYFSLFFFVCLSIDLARCVYNVSKIGSNSLTTLNKFVILTKRCNEWKKRHCLNRKLNGYIFVSAFFFSDLKKKVSFDGNMCVLQLELSCLCIVAISGFAHSQGKHSHKCKKVYLKEETTTKSNNNNKIKTQNCNWQQRARYYQILFDENCSQCHFTVVGI